MVTEKKNYLTQEGLQKLEDELEYLKVEKRSEVSEKIKVARGFGDLSENAEYDEAKNEQAAVEERILDIENILRNYELITDSGDHHQVRLGSKVHLKGMDIELDEVYTIVGSTETDPFHGKISNESPVGRAIIGKEEGEIVEVTTPSGKLKYQIVEIIK